MTTPTPEALDKLIRSLKFVGHDSDCDLIDYQDARCSCSFLDRAEASDALKALSSDNAALQSQCDRLLAEKSNGKITTYQIEQVRKWAATSEAVNAEHERIESDNWALWQDAERYRWLRDQKGLDLRVDGATWTRKDGSRFVSSHHLCANDTAYAAMPTLEETIDAAMLAGKEWK